MEFDRVIKLHKVEGPLPIPPRIVHSVGMVAKANGKVRDILDARLRVLTARALAYHACWTRSQMSYKSST